MFTRKDGKTQPILRMQKKESEKDAILRLQALGWDIADGNYEVEDLELRSKKWLDSRKTETPEPKEESDVETTPIKDKE